MNPDSTFPDYYSPVQAHILKPYHERFQDALVQVLGFGQYKIDPNKAFSDDPGIRDILRKYHTDVEFHALAHIAASLVVENEDLRARLGE